MPSLYRIYPVLWNDGIGMYASTVYAVDRAPPSGTFPTACSNRVREDPAYSWESGTFQRLLPPPDAPTPPCGNAVTWSTLPAWLSFVQTKGFTLSVDLSRLKPYSDVYISGP